jgi:hypothetical protein
MITRNHIRPSLEYVQRSARRLEMSIIAIICLGLLMGVAATEAKAT